MINTPRMSNISASASRLGLSRTPSRVQVLVSGNGHFVSPSSTNKGDVPIDPELLAMDVDPVSIAQSTITNGNGIGDMGSDQDAEGSDEDAEGEAVDEGLQYEPWDALRNVSAPNSADIPPDSHYATSHYSSSSRNDAGPSTHTQPPDLTSMIHGLDASSPTSTTAAAPSNKRGRLPRASTSTSIQPNGNGNGNGISASATAGPSSLKLKIRAPKTVIKSKGKGRASYDNNGVIVPDPYCSFCAGTNESNKIGKPEKMVSCHVCGRSGHFSCLDMTSPDLIQIVQEYDWECIECKTCQECVLKENEDELMFCDGCDKGWHFACANPPLKRLPKGSWRCHHCRARSSQTHRPSSHPMPDPPSAYKYKGKGKGKALDFLPSHLNLDHTPSTTTRKSNGKPRKSGHTQHPTSGVYDEAPSTQKNARRPKARPGSSTPGQGAYSPTPELAAPPRINIRLRIPARHKTAEAEEAEEEKIPYGGVIEGEDADTTRTTIIESDKLAFERSRRIAEDKLGGPPPGPTTTAGGGTWEVSGQGLGSPVSTPGPSRSQSFANAAFTPNSKVSQHHQQQSQLSQSLSRSLRDRLFTQAIPLTPDTTTTPHASPVVVQTTPAGQSQKINKIRFGQFDIDTWYSAPYPEEYQHVPEGRLWLCEFCLKFMKSGFVAGRHRMKCKARHPPGDEIYRDGTVSVFEVDGRKNKIYCQNLCLLAKMFLDHKTLYYDVEPFLFYVMTEVDDLGARFVGYFSKEKRSPDNNVSCIMTLPVRQRKGWGQLLIDFSYLLSKKEGRVGSPEKPLSGLGAVTYKKYWQLSVFQFLRDKTGPITLEQISAATSMTLLDIYTTLLDADFIRVQPLIQPPRSMAPTSSRGRGGRFGRGRGAASRGRNSLHRNATSGSMTDIDEPEIPVPGGGKEDVDIKIPDAGRYEITYDRDYVSAILAKHASKGQLELRPERLKYHPFLVSRNLPIKPGNITEVIAAAIANDVEIGEKEGEGGEKGMEEDVVEKVIQHGEDEETLALVAALAQETSPVRSLRKRTSGGSMDNGETPRSIKRLRRSVRGTVPVSPVARRGRSSRILDEVIVVDGDGEGEEPHQNGIDVDVTEGEEKGVSQGKEREMEVGNDPSGALEEEEVVEEMEISASADEPKTKAAENGSMMGKPPSENTQVDAVLDTKQAGEEEADEDAEGEDDEEYNEG